MSRLRRVKRGRKIAALLAILLIAGLVPLFNLGGATAAKTTDNLTFQDQQLVFMEQENTGEVTATRVIDWMQFDGNGNISVNAPTDLSKAPKAQGIRSFETAGVKDGSLVLNNVGVSGLKNVITQLTLSKDDLDWAVSQVPLTTEYTYWLDGEPVANLKDIAGRSGHFKLQLKLRNTSNKLQDVTYTDSITGQKKTERVETYMPLVVQPYDWYFDNAVFSSVTCDETGIVFGMPTFYQIGWSIPLFPPATEATNTIWVEADVKNFSLDPLTLAIAFVYPKTNQTDPLPEFASGLTELYSGADQLGAGIQEAAAGVGTTGTNNTLLYGISQITSGLKTMASPVEGLPAAQTAITEQLLPGVAQMMAGVGTLRNPSSITGGLAQIAAGIGDPSVADTLLYAIDQMIAGLEEAKVNIGTETASGTLLYGATGVKGGLTTLRAATAPGGVIDTYLNNVYAIGTSLLPDPRGGQLQAIATGLIDNITSAIPASGSIYVSIGTTSTPDTLLYGIEGIIGGLKAIKGGIGSGGTYGTLLFAANAISSGLTSMKAAIGNTTTPNTLIYGTSSVYGGLGLLQGGLAQIAGGLSTAVAGLGSAGTPDTLIFGSTQIQGGLSQLKTGLDTAVSSGTDVMKAALSDSLHELNLTFGELAAIQQRGEAFDSFLGKPDNANQSDVRFIMQTKPVQASWTNSSWVLALVLSILAVIALVLIGLFAFRKFA